MDPQTILAQLRDLTRPGMYGALAAYPWRHLVDDWDVQADADDKVVRITTRWKNGTFISGCIPYADGLNDTWVDAYKRALSTVLPEAIFGDEVAVEYDTPEM